MLENNIEIEKKNAIQNYKTKKKPKSDKLQLLLRNESRYGDVGSQI